MSHKLSFGMYKGKSIEWLFFHAPWYVEWLFDEDFIGDRRRFTWEQERHIKELNRRASHLTGICSHCKQRPIKYMGLSTHYGSGALGAIGFYCDECEYLGGSPTGYYRSSFFVEAYTMPRCEQLRITQAIKDKFIGDGRLTQAKMEEFFQTDANFPRATIGYFGAEHE